MPIEIISPIPDEILASGSGSGDYILADNSFDIALAGIPFILATTDNRPYTREVAAVRKQMFDNFAEPGEYSMTEWWLRSQSDFGGGQGLTYQDPDVDNRFNIKFHKSTGVNVWNPGEFELLPEAISAQLTQLGGNNHGLSHGYFNGFQSIPRVWFTAGPKLYSYDVETATVTNVLYSGADPEAEITSITGTGNKYYVANTTGIYSGTGAGAGTKIWNTGAFTVINWVKGRLMAGIGPSIYELVGAGPALPVAKFTHLLSGWEWSSIAEGPNAIYFAGSLYPDCSIYKLVLEVDGAVPTLASGGTVSAIMPPGEQINTIYCYLGTFMGIATNRGFRVGILDSAGDVSYGPLLWEKESYGIQGDDRFFYVGVVGGIDLQPDIPDKKSNTFPGILVADDGVCDGIYRVDLGQELRSADGSSVKYAYSTDRYLAKPRNSVDPITFPGNMPLQSIAQIGDRYLFAVYQDTSPTMDDGYIALWPTDREFDEKVFLPAYSRMPDGYLETGRVRFNTQEPKAFRFFSTRAPVPLDGDIDVDILDGGGGVTRYITYTPAHPPDVGDIPLSAITTPQAYISLRFTLHRNTTDTSLGAIVNGWQIKAWPAAIRQRVFTFTVLCFDHEQDKTGQTQGYEGYALERLQLMEQIAQRSNVILLQDLYQNIGSQVLIEDMQFIQMAPPGPDTSGWGGYITFRLKTVSDVIA